MGEEEAWKENVTEQALLVCLFSRTLVLSVYVGRGRGGGYQPLDFAGGTYLGATPGIYFVLT